MCKHTSIIGDNYGETCTQCGEPIAGYGYGGWFGIRLSDPDRYKTCIHRWLPWGDDEEICSFCEEVRTATRGH